MCHKKPWQVKSNCVVDRGANSGLFFFNPASVLNPLHSAKRLSLGQVTLLGTKEVEQ